MPYPVYKSKGDIRSKVLARCGYGGLGAAAGNFVPFVDDLLDEGQEMIFELLPDEKRKQEFFLKTSITPDPQIYYDVPSNMDLEQIDYFGVYVPSGTPNWQANEQYAVGDIVAPTTSNGFNYKVQSIAGTGTSGSIEPTWPVVIGNTVIDNAGANQITWVCIDINLLASGSRWIPMKQGIYLPHDSLTAIATYPRKYDIRLNPTVGYTQIEIWPNPDAVYQMKIKALTQLGAFVADDDPCSVDYRLLVQYATAMGKAHLNKPDAKQAMDAWNVRYRRLKANQHGNERQIRGVRSDYDTANPRPKVV